jgi:hypothetical protein
MESPLHPLLGRGTEVWSHKFSCGRGVLLKPRIDDYMEDLG